jgi:hypothetical protein
MSAPLPPLTVLRRRLAGAKARCARDASAAPAGHSRGRSANYAHVAFEFSSPAEGARQLLAKLGPIPPGMSLDRVDPHGPYSLENLRYASPRLQVLNRRRKSSIKHVWEE